MDWLSETIDDWPKTIDRLAQNYWLIGAKLLIDWNKTIDWMAQTYWLIDCPKLPVLIDGPKLLIDLYLGIEELFEWWTVLRLELRIRTRESGHTHAQATTYRGGV